MDVTKAFATRLKILREEKGLSQDELGKAIGISRGSISFYEKQSRTPDITVLAKVSNFFDVSLDYLLGFADSRSLHGVIAENETGLSEDTTNAIKDYKTAYSPEEIKILNLLIQAEEIMDICELINESRNYSEKVRERNPVQFHVEGYLHMPELYKKHSLETLKKYLEDCNASVSDNELLEIDNFVNNYITVLTQVDKYTAKTINIVEKNDKREMLLDEAIEIFFNIAKSISLYHSQRGVISMFEGITDFSGFMPQ